MARESICAKLIADQDFSCISPVRKYVQQFVAIPLTEKLYSFLEPRIGRDPIVEEKKEGDE